MSETLFPADSLDARIGAYENSAAVNEGLHAEFTSLTDRVAFLKSHRDWVEANAWGYGDRAFHYMWLLVLADIAERFEAPALLEIGVFKGQTIGLWALIARELGCEARITAVAPFSGNVGPQPRLWHSLRKRFDGAYRRADAVGNLHPVDDYLARCGEIFAAFGLDFTGVTAIKGLSTDAQVRAQVADRGFALVYIDGDHCEEVARADIAAYAPRVMDGGYVVMDDAARDLPGATFWKGFESVTRACQDLPGLGFANVLNIGHNRIFRKETAG